MAIYSKATCSAEHNAKDSVLMLSEYLLDCFPVTALAFMTGMICKIEHSWSCKMWWFWNSKHCFFLLMWLITSICIQDVVLIALLINCTKIITLHHFPLDRRTLSWAIKSRNSYTESQKLKTQLNNICMLLIVIVIIAKQNNTPNRNVIYILYWKNTHTHTKS